MNAEDQPGEAPDEPDRYRAGLPDHHDPTASIVGGVPAYSALTLRLTLALFGFVVCVALAIWAVMVDARGTWVALLVLLAVVAVIDVAVILRRKRRREPG